ncbi:class I SAM-dependent methyltransferase [Staphylothermus hellenicus]|uniref:Methyltransferase type 11 n=1 Tax=Staphylothermus hellenicus (strain DSM 12710 / JCM 10830 / BK20S6-10-b1 / P8) TaxID=591019 RepID=D7D891_STAHD|nr:class I SAM-dependent methyltransferase [Staphylothermus hellenicus]ADI31987.1 Methyltransferase type 11 [Staphylothermus hellenicus DSM 12710]
MRQELISTWKAIKPYIDGANTLLDLGSGRGAFAEKLYSKARHVIALDIDYEALSHIDKPFIMKLCADAQNIPLRDESVDVVIAISLIEHLQDPIKCLHEASRVLKEGGYLIIQLPNLQYYVEPHTKFPLFILPYRFKELIRKRLGYAYINFNVTLKYILNHTPKELELIRKMDVYHKIKTPPWPPAWILIYKKTNQQQYDS